MWRLPFFLRNPVNLAESRAIFRTRLENREDDLLRFIKRTVYEYPASPYLPLLKHSGCAYGDLEKLVRRDGAESALQALFREGVYLTVRELKGREPLVRGSLTMSLDPSRLRNPLSAAHATTWTSGSRGARAVVPVDLRIVRERAVDKCLVLAIPEGKRWRHAVWQVPGGAAISQLLQYTLLSTSPVRWFTQLDPSTRELHPRYRWSVSLLRWAGKLTRVPLARPVHVPLEDPSPIIRWIVNTLADGDTPILHTFPSSAVILSRTALEEGVSLRGAYFNLGGEMTTKARLAVIRRTGAQAWPVYGSRESGILGQGCLRPEVSDELHLLKDLAVVIQPAGPVRHELPADSLLVSSIRPHSPYTLLNVYLGDTAKMTQRTCGCGLEELGLTTHLHTVRSEEKLTAGGMTFLDADVVRVLEEVLPARFGGAPTDYQLLEEDDADAIPRLKLLVHPSVRLAEPDEVVRTFFDAIADGSGAERIMGLLWRDGKFVQLERRPPLSTASGKILHLHLHRDAELEPLRP